MYWATLESPAFDIQGRWVELQSAIYGHLGRFNLRLNDIKVESATSNPGDVSIACWLFNSDVVVRYRLDRVEVWSNRVRIAKDKPLQTEIVGQAMGVLRSVSPNSRVSQHTINIPLHGSIGDGSLVNALVAAYVTRWPEGPRSLIPSGVSFLCDFANEGRGSIILERSGLVTDGLFLRVQCELVGSLSEVDAVSRAREFFRESTGRLGLDVLWGS